MMHRVRLVLTSSLLAFAVGCSIPVEVVVNVPEPPVRERPVIEATRTADGVELKWDTWEKLLGYLYYLEGDIDRIRVIIRSLRGNQDEPTP